MQGSALYREVLVFKPPMTVWVHSLSQLLFGQQMSSIRWLDGMFHCATAWSMYLLIRHWVQSRAWALFTAISYPVLYSGFDYWHGAQTDGWLNCPVFVGLAVLVVNPSLWRWAFAGTCVALAFWLKFTYLAGFVVFLAIWWMGPRKPQTLLALISGFVAFSIVVLTFLVLQGSLNEFLHHIFQELPHYVSLHDGSIVRRFLIGFSKPPLWAFAILSISYCVVSCFAFFRGYLRLEWYIPTNSLLLVGIVSCVSQGKFFLYHYSTLLAPLLLCCGLTFAVSSRRGHWIPSGMATILAVGTWSLNVDSVRERVSLMQYPERKLEYWKSQRFVRSDYSMSEQLALVEWIENHSNTNDTLFVWGFDPSINFLSNRINPTKYIYNYPFRVRIDKRDASELVAALTLTKPDFFVVSRHDSTPWVTGNNLDSYALISQYPALRGFLESNYTREQDIGRYMVLQWIGPPED